MKPEKLFIKQVSLRYDRRNVFVIETEEGDWFRKNDDEVRSFKDPSLALSFLKHACSKYPTLGYMVTMPSGNVKELGMMPYDESKFGPHHWSKKNLVTISVGFSSYDIYICEYCRKEEKSYGLSGHPRTSGVCPKNPLTGEK